MDNNILQEKPTEIFNDNVKWLLYSGIRIKNGNNIGAVYGWKNLTPPSYPFIYSEITGYAITSYVYIYSELKVSRSFVCCEGFGKLDYTKFNYA